MGSVIASSPFLSLSNHFCLCLHLLESCSMLLGGLRLVENPWLFTNKQIQCELACCFQNAHYHLVQQPIPQRKCLKIWSNLLCLSTWSVGGGHWTNSEGLRRSERKVKNVVRAKKKKKKRNLCSIIGEKLDVSFCSFLLLDSDSTFSYKNRPI